jgi:hypothetical protein
MFIVYDEQTFRMGKSRTASAILGNLSVNSAPWRLRTATCSPFEREEFARLYLVQPACTVGRIDDEGRPTGQTRGIETM